LPASRLAGATFLVVDDLDAAPPRSQGPYEHKLQLAQLDLVASSQAQSQVLAENYVGMLERVMVGA
jgi:hypothetical protein